MIKFTAACGMLTLGLWLQEISRPAPAAIGVDPVTVTLIGGIIVTIIGTIVTGIVTVITALRAGVVMTQQAATTQRLDTVAKDTEAIKGHVNSEKTASEGREIALRKENEMLREIISDKKATAALLAQAKVAVDTVTAVPMTTGGKKEGT